MKKLFHLTLCLLFITLTKCDELDKVNIGPQPVPVITNNTTPTPPTTPEPTTGTPNTTAAPTTTPPPPPTTTTPPPPPTTTTTTTTPPPPPTTTTTTTTTTTPTTPTTTTTKPTTPTTSAPVTTTTPAPKKEIGTWYLNYTGTNETCIIMKMELELRVPYNKTDNKTGNATILVPPKAKTTGDCGDGKKPQNITLQWESITNGNLDSITFSFVRSNTSKQFMLASISATIAVDKNFPNATSNNTISASLVKDEFITPIDMSYRCMKEETLNLPIKNSNSTVEFVVSNMQIQAFYNTTTMEFSTAKDCMSHETPGIVPIAVGCSLAALIIIVLIAFLVGRRRTQVRGYLSM